jgi:hypothetical protein
MPQSFGGSLGGVFGHESVAALLGEGAAWLWYRRIPAQALFGTRTLGLLSPFSGIAHRRQLSRPPRAPRA